MARRWPTVFSNALEPGWVATRMGGSGASDDLDQGHRTQVWLAVSEDAAARATGEYFYHLRKRAPNPEVRDEALQEESGRGVPAYLGRGAAGLARRYFSTKSPHF